MPEDNILNKPVAIIGEDDVISGFKALGLKAHTVKTSDDCKHALAGVIQDNSAVCLLQDDFYRAVEDEIAVSKISAEIVFIPFSKKAQAVFLDKIVKDIRLRATGVF